MSRLTRVFYSIIKERPVGPAPLYPNTAAGSTRTIVDRRHALPEPLRSRVTPGHPARHRSLPALLGHGRPPSPRPFGAWRIWMAGLATLPWLFPVPATAQAPAQPVPSPTQSDEAAVTQVVLGIISYTRWPVELPALHLCVLATPRWAAGLLQQARQVRDRPVLPRRLQSLDESDGCNIIYTGAISDAERQALSERLAGSPVLSISENDPDCSIGSMFCLNVRDGRVTFMVNLDSVARSGVRVNPAVLQLGRRAQAPNGAAPR
jgi:hypothetical protein